MCPSHGYLSGEQHKCQDCSQETEIYSRVVGYLRPVKQWNNGKQAEYSQRKPYAPDTEPDEQAVPMKITANE